MKYPQLFKAKVIKKYKMFFVDAILESTGETITAYTRNKGGFKKEMAPNRTIYVSYDGNPNRKTQYSVELLENDQGQLTGVDTQLSNKLFEQFLKSDNFLNLKYEKKEVFVNEHTRLDFSVIDQNNKLGYVEIKSILTYDQDTGLFPENKTERGQKHLETLIKLSKKHPVYLIYIVQVPHAKNVRIRHEIDPDYVKLMHKLKKTGGHILALKCEISLKANKLTDSFIPILF